MTHDLSLRLHAYQRPSHTIYAYSLRCEERAKVSGVAKSAEMCHAAAYKHVP